MRFRLLIAAMIALLPVPALAWDDYGHMVVAAIAWQKLDAPAPERVAALLPLNPDYPKWVSGVADADKAETAFIRAATWPDAIKGEAGYTNDGETPNGSDAARNIGYADKLQHRYWHYIDLPFSPDGTPVQQPAAPNAQTQITSFRTVLASNASDDIKSYDLVWLEHLVGDIHQPLHATSRFTHDLPNGDQGGNLVKITCSPSCPRSLHAYWDDVLGKSESVDEARTEAAHLLRTPMDVGTGTEADWVRESFEEAQRTVYAAPVGVGSGTFALDAAYEANAKKVAENCVELAGLRLGSVLNQALK